LSSELTELCCEKLGCALNMIRIAYRGLCISRPLRLQANRKLSISSSRIQGLIREHTAIDAVHGIQLALLTPSTQLYYCRDERLLPFPEPWWAFLWPGGRALTKFIVDNPSLVAHKRILDIGSGCGSASIACLRAGARTVVANDIDPIAGAALEVNLELNGFDSKAVSFVRANLMEESRTYFQQYDVVICGDMLYDCEYSASLVDVLASHPCAIFGDVGRTYCPKAISDNCLLASYDYNEDGFPSMFVFRLTADLVLENSSLWAKLA
jgi:predicted nicotinamide N-methyase